MQPSATPAVTKPPGGEYNLVPYVSHPFPQSEPARLIALGILFGLTPPPVETASILELGCASGGNIIPLSVRLPRAHLLGVDLTPRHVEEGRSRIKALGLTNIQVRQGDVTSLDLPEQAFDYIIAHGVYSWVPPAARDAILRIAGRSLSPNGIAYISYNVFPGWQMRGIIRDLMLFHAGREGEAPPLERIAKARWVLDNLAKLTNPGNSYGAKLREEAGTLATFRDDYILGEFLAPENAPCYFREFNAAAEARGLLYLCESEIESCLPETHGPEVAALIRTMSANQLIPLEQYIDFLMGRTFRQTLLVRKEQAASIRRQLEPERARSLHVSGKLEFSAEASTADRYLFKIPDGRTVTTTSTTVRRALDKFAAAFPETRTLAELVREISEPGAPIDAADEASILDALFRMIVAGLVKVSGVPVRAGKATAQRPVAWPLARADAAAGRTSTTNLRHETSAIEPVAGVLLPYLDGTHNRMMLHKRLLQAVRSHRIEIKDDKTGISLGGDALDKAVVEHVDLAIRRLAEAALLEPDVVGQNANDVGNERV